jgi:hypothetical protein
MGMGMGMGVGGRLVRLWGCYSVSLNDRERSGSRIVVRADKFSALSKFQWVAEAGILFPLQVVRKPWIPRGLPWHHRKGRKGHLLDSRPYAGELRVVCDHRLDVPVELGSESGRRLSLPGLV